MLYTEEREQEMACKTSFELHHNFPKLAEEAGFTFNTHRPRVHIQWSKIKLIDIEDIVKNRNFTIVEQHLNDVLDCVIDLEFDVRILDDGFLKIFRLAQLAVEYQQFCRHYLDRSVFVLREEITSLLQELDSTKKALKEKEEESRKIKRKMKHPVRAIPYGNDNIAKMILSALGQNKNELFPSSSQLDTMHYNKCNYCDKAFLNQLYLKSHITRRHGNVVEVPQKDNENEANVNSELNNEIIDLKLKLKQMEELILNSKIKETTNSDKAVSYNANNVPAKEVKDAEVWTNNDIIEITEPEKKAEQDTYTKEIKLLRTQILDIIKDKENHSYKHSENEIKIMEQLHTTIKNQGDEILALKQELQKGNSRDMEERQKIVDQLDYWSKKAENQANDFKALLQKLNDVENEAREYRAKAESEKEKTGQLQNILQQHLSKAQSKPVASSNKSTMISDEVITSKKPTESKKITTSLAEDAVLKKLQERAQELLNINQLSSESSNMSDVNTRQNHKKQLKDETMVKKRHVESDDDNYEIHVDLLQRGKNKMKTTRKKEKNDPKTKKLVTLKKDVNLASPGSPIKVVRAKLTEEVNNRLVSLGIDPLKNKLPKSAYLKQRMLLQEQQDIKLKRFPTREKVVHSLMAHLDTNASEAYQGYTEKNGYMRPSKMSRAFSLSSVLSNVKTKALSMVKSNEKIETPKKSYKDIAKKATAFLKSSPESNRPGQISTEVGYEESNHKLMRQNISNSNVEADRTEFNKNLETSSSKYLNRKLIKTKGHNDSESSEQDLIDTHKMNSTNIVNLIKSPVRKPSDILMNSDKMNDIEQEPVNSINRSQNNDDSSDGIESLLESPPRKALSEENVNSLLITKGVLKSATSTSSLNKKKVLFDMDAIQMKSVSASPSQSTTERSNNEQYELGITNLDTEEWDLSSIENLVLPEISKEVIKSNTTKRQSPKFVELKETIESKLMGRNQTLSTTPIGGVDVLSVPMQKGTSLGGSNTSLGSSILDDADSSALQNQK